MPSEHPNSVTVSPLAAARVGDWPAFLVDVIHPDGRHNYWSTHCRHAIVDDNPVQHGDCQATEHAPGVARRLAQCKTCGAPCACPCHIIGGPMETGHRVTAKAKVNYKSGDDPVSVSFLPDYQDERNKAWASATPSLSLTMSMKPEVADLFEVGEAIDITFSRNPDQPVHGHVALSEADQDPH